MQIRDSSESTQIHQFIGYRGACLTGGMKFVVRPPFDRDTLNDCLASCADAGKNCSFLVFHLRIASSCEDLLGCSGVCYKFSMACTFAYWKENSQSFVAATYVKLNNHSSIGSDFAVSEFKGMEDMDSYASGDTAATASANIDASLVSPATNDYIDSSNESVPATGGHAPSTKLQTDHNETLDSHNRTVATLPHYHVTHIPAYSNFSQAHTPAVTVRRSNSQDQSTTLRQPEQIQKEMSFAESIQTAASAENRSAETNIEIDELGHRSPAFYQAISLNQTGSADGHAEAHKSIAFHRNESITAVFGRTTVFTNDKDRHFRGNASAVTASGFATFTSSIDTSPDKQTIINHANKGAEQQSMLTSTGNPHSTVDTPEDRFKPDSGTFPGLKRASFSSSLHNASECTTIRKDEHQSSKNGSGEFDATSVSMATCSYGRQRLQTEAATSRNHAPSEQRTGRPTKRKNSSAKATVKSGWNVSGKGESGQAPQTGEPSQDADYRVRRPNNSSAVSDETVPQNLIHPRSAYDVLVTLDGGAGSNSFLRNETTVTIPVDAARIRHQQDQTSAKSLRSAGAGTGTTGDGYTMMFGASQERPTSKRVLKESSNQSGQFGTVTTPKEDKEDGKGNEQQSFDDVMRRFSMVVKRGVNKLTINSTNATESD